MNRYKRTLSFILLFSIIFSIGFQNVYAHDLSMIESAGVGPQAETACEYGNGIHQMERRGLGSVKTASGTNLIYSSPCWQCKNCYLVMVTSDDPTAANGKVGYYKTEAYFEPISKYGAIIYVPNGTVLPYVGTKTMTGFRFFNNTSGFNLFNVIG